MGIFTVAHHDESEFTISLVAAIANYTTRIVDPTLDPEQIQEALLFLDHVGIALSAVYVKR